MGLRVARDLARLRRHRGRASEARDLFAPVYAAFTEGFAFPDLVEARAPPEELGAATADGVKRRHEEVRTFPGPDRFRARCVMARMLGRAGTLEELAWPVVGSGVAGVLALATY